MVGLRYCDLVAISRFLLYRSKLYSVMPVADVYAAGNHVTASTAVEIRLLLQDKCPITSQALLIKKAGLKTQGEVGGSEWIQHSSLCLPAVIKCADEGSSLRPVLQHMDTLLMTDKHDQLLDEIIDAMDQVASDSQAGQLLREIYRFLLSCVESLTASPREWLVQAANCPSDTR